MFSVIHSGRFFIDNKNEDAIAPNQWEFGRPHLIEMYEAFKKLEQMKNVAWVRVAVQLIRKYIVKMAKFMDESDGKETYHICIGIFKVGEMLSFNILGTNESGCEDALKYLRSLAFSRGNKNFDAKGTDKITDYKIVTALKRGEDNVRFWKCKR